MNLIILHAAMVARRPAPVKRKRCSSRLNMHTGSPGAHGSIMKKEESPTVHTSSFVFVSPHINVTRHGDAQRMRNAPPWLRGGNAVVAMTTTVTVPPLWAGDSPWTVGGRGPETRLAKVGASLPAPRLHTYRVRRKNVFATASRTNDCRFPLFSPP